MKAKPAFRLGVFDQLSEQYLVRTMEKEGKLVRWVPGLHPEPYVLSPCFLAPRKGHMTGRLVIDFTRANLLYNCAEVVPPLAEAVWSGLLDPSEAARYLILADLALGYHHVALDPAEQPFL